MGNVLKYKTYSMYLKENWQADTMGIDFIEKTWTEISVVFTHPLIHSFSVFVSVPVLYVQCLGECHRTSGVCSVSLHCAS